jgi:ABC-type transport system substrate-binding protein
VSEVALFVFPPDLKAVLSRADFHTAPWIDLPDYPDPQALASGLNGSLPYFGDAHYQALVTQADALPEGPARTALFVQAQRIALENAEVIPLGQSTWSVRWRPTVHGFYVSTEFGFQPLNNDWTNARVD